MRRAVAAAIPILLAGCAPSPDRAAATDAAPASTSVVIDARRAASAPASAAPDAPAVLRAQPARPPAPRTDVEQTAMKMLARGRIVAVRRPGEGAPPGAARCGIARLGGSTPERLEALIEPGGGEPRWVDLWLAHRSRPGAWRRPLAFHRLAAAIGARIVPTAAPRRVGVAEIGPLLGALPGGPELLRDLSVLNDGTIDALALAPAPGPPGPRWDAADPAHAAPLGFDDRGPLCPRRAIHVESAPEIDRWARWAASPTPLPGERPGLVRDYVEALALDFLAGNVLRSTYLLDETAGALVLADNAGAFPRLIHEHALDLVLSRLAAVARFPRPLRDALFRLDRAAAAAALAPGSLASLAPRAPAPPTAAAAPQNFASWLVAPRTLVGMDERRAALITLIEARIREHGEAIALSLDGADDAPTRPARLSP